MRRSGRRVRQSGRSGPSGRWAGYAAAAWAFLFAALSLYWAVGGMGAVETLSSAVREPALARPPWFVAVLWLTVLLKIGAGLLGLALSRPWGRAWSRRLLVLAGWGTGVLLALYGGFGMVNAGLAELGVVESTDPGTVRWYLYLWEPIWLVGGLFFIVAVRRFSRERGGRRL